MSIVSDALEREVAAIRAIRNRCHGRPVARDAATIDRHFARIMRLIAPRVRHFTRTYGLFEMPDDAEQACAMGVHRAIVEYDPDRAKFTTFVNWQLRCELQALRHRVRLDSRESARRVGARTVSLDALLASHAESSPFEIEDKDAAEQVEAVTSARLARAALERMLDAYENAMRDRALRTLARKALGDRPAMPGTIHPEALADVERELAGERAIVTHYVFAESDKAKFDPDHRLDSEQQRQISRRVLRNLRAQLGEARIN